jgi:hypothetical protein
MKIAIFEIGKYHDVSDVIRVFSSVEKARENIPLGFKDIGYANNYTDEANEKWLSIKEFEVEE